MHMTYEEWHDLAFRFGWIPTLLISFQQYYREDEDEDPSATDEMLAEVRWIYDRLMEGIGPCPPAPPVEPAPPASNIPF